MPKNAVPLVAVAAISSCAGALLVAAIVRPPTSDTIPSGPGSTLPPGVGTTGREEIALPDLVALSKDSIVTITCQDSAGAEIGTGSGFLASSGAIVTNWHVAAMGQRHDAIFLDGTRVPLEHVSGADETLDLALLHSSDARIRSRVSLPLADYVPRVGEEIVIIGNPLGFLEGTASKGIVSAIRSLEGAPLIQVTAPISPGSSGSPLLDRFGRVVGVVRSAIEDGQQLNFAVPIGSISKIAAMNRQVLSEWAVYQVSNAERSEADEIFQDVKARLIKGFLSCQAIGYEAQCAKESYDLLRLHPDVPRASFGERGETLSDRSGKAIGINWPRLDVWLLPKAELEDMRSQVAHGLERNPTSENLLRLCPLLYTTDVFDSDALAEAEAKQKSFTSIHGLLRIDKADAFDRFQAGSTFWDIDFNMPNAWSAPIVSYEDVAVILSRQDEMELERLEREVKFDESQKIRGGHVLKLLDGLESEDPRWNFFAPEVAIARGWAYCAIALESTRPDSYGLEATPNLQAARAALVSAMAQNKAYQAAIRKRSDFEGLAVFASVVAGEQLVINDQLVYIAEHSGNYLQAATLSGLRGERGLRLAAEVDDDLSAFSYRTLWAVMELENAGEYWLKHGDREAAVNDLRKIATCLDGYKALQPHNSEDQRLKRQYLEWLDEVLSRLSISIDDYRN